MSWVNFSKCNTVEEIGGKLMERFNGSEGHVAMATAFVHHLLQKELLIEQNKYQGKQLEKMQELNKHTRKLVTATWAIVIISLIANVVSGYLQFKQLQEVKKNRVVSANHELPVTVK